MRIIDKQYDFYDYLQDPTDDIVFDRRDSFLLSKDLFGRGMMVHYYNTSKYRFVTLQCGSTFWLFLATIKKFDKKFDGMIPIDYDFELLISWKNYDKPYKLLDINVVSFGSFRMYDYQTRDYDYDLIKSRINDLKDATDHNDFRLEYNVNNISNKSFPLLKASGLGSCIDGKDIFYAIEEYFSLEKMSLERTEPLGATNNDKIIMHGFDTKISFRGK